MRSYYASCSFDFSTIISFECTQNYFLYKSCSAEPAVILTTDTFFYSANDENDEGALDIAAFNVRVFGLSKINNNEVIQNLVKIILRYDLILIQEIRDSSGKTIQSLFKQLQLACSKNKRRLQDEIYFL